MVFSGVHYAGRVVFGCLTWFVVLGFVGNFLQVLCFEGLLFSVWICCFIVVCLWCLRWVCVTYVIAAMVILISLFLLFFVAYYFVEW